MLRRARESQNVMNFVVQVFATATGLLLAFGIDHWKTARAQRATALQARAFIQDELQRNRTELLRELKDVKEGLRSLMEYQKRLQVPGAFSGGPPRTLSLSTATLRSASWEAGIASQAVGYLEPWRVARISEAFAVQKDLQEVHRQLFNLLPVLSRLLSADTNPRDLQVKLDLDTLINLLATDAGAAQETLKGYDAALAACQ